MKRARADSIISRLRATKSTREVDRPKAENKLPIWSAIGTKDVFKLELCAQILRDRFAVAQLTDFNPTASLFIIGPLATDSDIARTGEGLKVTHQFVLQTTRTGVVPDPIAYTWRQSPKAPTVVVPGPAATVAPGYAEGLTIFNANRRIARYFARIFKARYLRAHLGWRKALQQSQHVLDVTEAIISIEQAHIIFGASVGLMGPAGYSIIEDALSSSTESPHAQDDEDANIESRQQRPLWEVYWEELGCTIDLGS